MASKISAIKTQLLADLAGTSIDKVYEGPIDDCTTYPWAEVAFTGGSIDESMTQVVDRIYGMTIFVHALSTEQVEVVMEELAVLWHSGAKLTTLGALGCILVVPDDHNPPFVYNDGTQGNVIGAMGFTFTVRLTV